MRMKEWRASRDGKTSFHTKFLEGSKAIDRIPLFKVCN